MRDFSLLVAARWLDHWSFIHGGEKEKGKTLYMHLQHTYIQLPAASCFCDDNSTCPDYILAYLELSKVCLLDFVASFRIWSFIFFWAIHEFFRLKKLEEDELSLQGKKKQLLIIVHLIAGLFVCFGFFSPSIFRAEPNKWTRRSCVLVAGFVYMIVLACPASVFFSGPRET